MFSDPDVIFSVGVLCTLATFPILLGAFAHNRSLSGAMGMGLTGALCIGAALIQKPTGYSVEQTPQILMEVAGRFTN